MPTPATTPPASRTARAYPGTPEQIRAVRADLRVLTNGCPLAEDLILCASELATNAVLYSNSHLPGATFTVRAEIHPGDCARIEVEDDGGPWAAHKSDHSRGYGLGIVGDLASDWGITGDYRGRTVWARLGWPHDPASQPAPDASATPATATLTARDNTAKADPLAWWTAVVDGDRLRELRCQRGLSEEELADQAGVSLSTVTRLERDQRPACRSWTLAQLAIALSEHPSAITAGRASTSHAGTADQPRN
jgi:serine/threonine-protein kinase RsbW